MRATKQRLSNLTTNVLERTTYKELQKKEKTMSYKLEKPYTDEDYANFIVEYNHNKGLRIEETLTTVFALENDEIIQDGNPIKNPDYENEKNEQIKEQRKNEIKLKLAELDLKTIRALREGGENEEGQMFLKIYQEEINALREELQTIS